MNPLTRLVTGSYAVLVLTAAHHLYGAVRFDTPWRAHVTHVAVLVGLALGICLVIWRVVPAIRRPAGWAVVIIALFPVGWIGLYEGGYNHVVKDVLYLIVGPSHWWQTMFPAPTYERPVDLWFESSGILQLVLAIWTAPALWQWPRTWSVAVPL